MARPAYKLIGAGTPHLRYNDSLGRPAVFSIGDPPRELPADLLKSGRVRMLINTGELVEVTNEKEGAASPVPSAEKEETRGLTPLPPDSKNRKRKKGRK
jgi:hypothetical protein